MASIYQKISSDNATTEIMSFDPKEGIKERHIVVHATRPTDSAEDQINAVINTYKSLLNGEMKDFTPVFQRFFLSDATNQTALLKNALANTDTSATATSIVQQAPLNGTKIAIWVYLAERSSTKLVSEGLTEAKHGNYVHYWYGTHVLTDGNSEQQTHTLLDNYAKQLEAEGLHLENDCIRTWFYVQNVDVNYGGVVKGRNDVFAKHDLTPQTHFIASTGIGGRNADKRALVQLNAYAVKGLKKGQIHFLYAKDHLNPTYEYGVSFERGTYVDYGDRRQVFISGTASIDNKGNVLYVGQIEKQVRRMWENVQALLNEGGCDFEDLCQISVYLRDPADYTLVNKMFEEKFPGVPKVILLAPVCRPLWLIEMECMAVKEFKNEQFANL